MNESILDSVKKLLGCEPDYTAFDSDIIICINTAIEILSQIGVKKQEGFILEDNTATWSDYLGEEKPNLQMVKSFIVIKTKILFDTPQSSTLIGAYEKQLEELTVRINWNVDKEE